LHADGPAAVVTVPGMLRFAGMAGVGRRDGTAELTCGIAPRPPGRPVCGKRVTDARQLCIIVLIH